MAEDVNFVEKIHDRFRCNICTDVFKDPQLITCCGEKYCHSCLTTWFGKPGSKHCPYCRSEKPNGMPWFVSEKGMKREIESFKVFCSNQKKGCNWTGELRNLAQHDQSESGCGYREVDCPNKCNTPVLRKDLPNHIQQDCPMRLIQCSYCLNTYLKKDLAEHLQECTHYPIECPNGCGEIGLIRRDENLHRAVCKFEVIACENAEKGCEVELQRRSMKSHQKEQCQYRRTRCKHCKESIIYIHLQEHEDVCDRFPVQCPNDCGNRKIERCKLQLHRTTCLMELVQCHLGCQKMVRRKVLALHQSTMCPFRKIVCRHCKKVCMAKDIEHHNNSSCMLYPIFCPNRCGKRGIIRKLLNDHKKECPMEEIPCKYSNVGCEKVCQRYKMDDHEESDQKEHLKLLSDAYATLLVNFESNQRQLALKENQLKRTTMDLEQVTTALEDMIIRTT